jgi:AraC-like DNA-binding protein
LKNFSTILVVKDELIIALDIKEILEQEGYNVIINTTVSQAIIAIEEHSPVLVLIGMNLNQKEDGVNLGEYLFQKKTVPFIYITSYTDNLTSSRIKETNPNGFIVKPFTPKDVLTTVDILLNNGKFKSETLENEIDSVETEIPFMLKSALRYIEENSDKKITIRELAEQSSCKERHFIRVFSKYIGKTPYQYILKLKIERAKKQLIETNIPTIEIANELGFQSYSNFNNAFKK